MSFKNETPDWNDLRLFLAVAKAGGLVGASGSCGASTPTLSRRMRHLENSMRLQLFDRHQGGYSLTDHGRDLLQKVQQMSAHSELIREWREELDQRPTITIAAGGWTSTFLARHLNEIAANNPGRRLQIRSGSAFVNLAQRQADIAIRNKIPEQQGMARRRIGPVSFAIYGAKEYCSANPDSQRRERFENCDWIALSVTGATGASTHWLREKIGARARLTCDSPQAVVEAAANGAGLCVLPRFIGETDTRLQACSDSIQSLQHTQWMLTHAQDGKQRHIRETSTAIAALFARHRHLFT